MRVQDFMNSARDVLTGGDAIRNVVVLFAIIAVLGVIVLAIAYFVQLASPKGRVEALLRDRAGESAGPVWPARLLVVPMVLLAFFGTGYYMARPSSCGQCHETSWAKSLAKSPHRGIGCMSCHGASGVTGFAREMVSYGRWIAVYGTTRQAVKTKGVNVDESNCVDCHSDVMRSTVVTRGIRVRHSDFVGGGVACIDCHGATAHPGATKDAARPTMSSCLICHNGARASAKCETCHVPGSMLKEIPSGRGFPKVFLSSQQEKAVCFTCHKKAPCYLCHGIDMPHPEGWSSPSQHARPAFASHKQVCWRCHFAGTKVFQPNPEACKPCHQPGQAERVHGGPAWLQEHGLEATGRKPGVLSQCFDCHTTSICGYCHPASYVKRYNPRTGPDSYPRTVPLNPSLVP